MKKLKLDMNDCFAFTGIGLVAAGAGLIYLPASFLVVGAFFFWIGIGRSGGD